MTTPICTIDAFGIHAPDYSDVLSYFVDGFRSIFGQDIYLEPDAQDFQLIAIFALALNDANAMAVATYNSFSPSTAQGVGLSRVVKINGIARAVPTRSTVDLVLVGQAGTTITDGIASDDAGARWTLPASVTIPVDGDITVTATAAELGAITAPANSITTIATPTRGWQSVNNPAAAVPGAPVENDAALRQRQTVSTALPSNTVLEGVIGAIWGVLGVTRLEAYENDTDVADSHGIPSHSLALVIEGGDATAIAGAIAAKKSPGSGTYGTTSVTVADAYGIPHIIRFYRPTNVPITVAISLKVLAGYTTAVETSIKQAVADYVNATRIGGLPSGTVEWDGAVAAAKSVAGKAAFRLVSLALSRSGGAGTPDVPLAFNEAATCAAGAVTVTVVP